MRKFTVKFNNEYYTLQGTAKHFQNIITMIEEKGAYEGVCQFFIHDNRSILSKMGLVVTVDAKKNKVTITKA